MKKMEKSSVASHREYLDINSDEEEFGRPETPEPEEELKIEPEKPVFAEEELSKLVQYVKDLTTLPGPEESKWSPEVIEVVEEYFRNPAKMILAIFHEMGVLRARLNFPERTDHGLTYFLRSSWQIYTPDNFLLTVMFGSVGKIIEISTLKFVCDMYAPIAFNSDEWPVVTRNKIFSHLHQFLMYLTDATYNPMGLTILYVPREGLNEEKRSCKIVSNRSTSIDLSEEKFCEDEDKEAEGLIERLERVARYWIRQIREALNGAAGSAETFTCATIVEEILHWQYRYLPLDPLVPKRLLIRTNCTDESSIKLTTDENMSCLYSQLTNDSVTSIVRKLEHERSASIKQYNLLLSQVRRILDEATSNITYLNILGTSNRGFDIPDGIEDYATRILSLIRFVGIESPFYNGNNNMEKLCRAFGTQVVEHLQRYINFEVIFDGDPDEGRKVVVECTVCCEKIKYVYDRFVDMDQSTDMPVLSLTCRTRVFSHVDTFLQRCNDLIGIADSRMIFDKSEKSITICGPRAIKLGTLYRKIEDSFRAILREIKDARDDILDMASSTWLNRMAKFHDGIRNVENMVKNWINTIFEDITNVEEGIEALHGIKALTGRNNLRDTLNDKWIQMWKIFGIELESCSMSMKKLPRLVYHPSLPPYSGNANIIRSNKMYLNRQHKILTDASDWFGDCDAQNVITKKYISVLATTTEKEEALFLEWRNHLADEKINPESIFDEPILQYRDNGEFRTIQVNLATHHLENIRESMEWALLGYETKNILSKNFPKWSTLKLRFNEVERICTLYNGISKSNPETESLLFFTLWDELEDTIRLGCEKITWRSEAFPKFFTDCMGAIAKVQKSFEAYKTIENAIDHTMKGIAKTNLVNRENKSLEILEDLKKNLERNRIHGALEVSEKCEAVLKLLSELKTTIYLNEPQTVDSWSAYIENAYDKLRANFVNCLRLSLTSILKMLRDDTIVESSQWRGSIKEAKTEVLKIHASAFKEPFPAEEFANVFETKDVQVFLDCIDRDPKMLELQARIDEYLNPIQSKR